MNVAICFKVLFVQGKNLNKPKKKTHDQIEKNIERKKKKIVKLDLCRMNFTR